VRRGLSRGRALIGIGAVLALVGVWLPWYTVGGEVLPSYSANGFDGVGVLVFFAAVGMLGLLTLPYASRHGTSGLDRAAVFGAVVLVGLVGLGIEVLTSFHEGRLSGPDRAPGLWLSAVGVLVALWGTAELAAESRAPL
jgi:hypothetical protein